MPYSDTRFDPIAIGILRLTWRKSKPVMLDIGAGAGKGARLFGPLAEAIDAVEAYRKNIEEFDLRSKYREVFCQDIRDWSPGQLSPYHVLFAGDMLEHLSVPDAKQLLDKARLAGCSMIVIVPFLYEQGALDGNLFERHLQPDLTQAVMASRYPQLYEVYADLRLGVYVL